MGSRRELLASLAFVGAVVLGFQAIDPLRDQPAGGAAVSRASRWKQVVMKTAVRKPAGPVGERMSNLRTARHLMPPIADEEEAGPRSMPSVQYTAEGVIVRRLTTGSAMKVCSCISCTCMAASKHTLPAAASAKGCQHVSV